jgi:ABC-type lipoprotein release transport system permease subunit
MGRLLLVGRLAGRDLRRRPGEAALLLLAIMAATTTLTLGLVLGGVASGPYQRTREATAGPDVVASVTPDPLYGGTADVAGLQALADAPGVIGHSGPYPVIGAHLEAGSITADVQAEGRDPAPAAIDQPEVTRGSWVRDGGVVVEAAFADALGLGAGDAITLNGQPFEVAGVAVTAAMVPYPQVSCLVPCWYGPAADRPADPTVMLGPAGLVWITEADARLLAPAPDSLAYVMNLKLADPSAAPAFVDVHFPTRPPAPFLEQWQVIRAVYGDLVAGQREALLTGGWLLGLLAVASVSVLVGGRMADQTRRVGLLKAVGGTPGLVAAVLFAEYVVVALAAAAAGLAVGWLTAPLLTESSAGLLGSAGAPPLSRTTVVVVTAVALGVAVAATFVPAVRSARTSTVRALADVARRPQRTGWLVAVSARLPVTLLLGLRLVARRPRRAVLGVVSVAITVTGVTAALTAHAGVNSEHPTGLDKVQADRLDQALLIITVTLLALAAVNAIFITWATALDARQSSALERALGATPHDVSAGLAAAQLLPALTGAILGIPAGLGLFAAVSDDAGTPPLWQLVAVIPGTALVVASLTAIPVRLGARRPAAAILQSELA